MAPLRVIDRHRKIPGMFLAQRHAIFRGLQTHLCVLVLITLIAARPSLAQIGGAPGAFSRMGFGSRGAGMGNALTAVTTGEISSYYNPALLPFAVDHAAMAAFGVLSLDRRLNFLGYTQHLNPNAGLSAGIINAGVSNIDGRDADGIPTGQLKTSENIVFLGFGNQFKGGLALGINVKLLYYHLYTDMTSTTAGVDLGALYPIGDVVTVGASLRDLGSKYKWNSSPVYGSDQGSSPDDPFPTLFTLGGAYKLLDTIGTLSADLEFSNQKTVMLRVGAEVTLIPEVTIRAGMDRIDLKDKGNGVRPSFGFTFRRFLNGFTPAIHYAFISEPFAPTAMHLVSLSATF